MKYTAQFKKKVVAEVHDGLPITHAAEKYKCSKGAIRGWSKHYGVQAEKVDTPVKVVRTERVALSDQDKLVLFKKDPNMEYRGVVEGPNRLGEVEKYKLAGWEPVPTSSGRRMANINDAPDPGGTLSQPAGGGEKVYYMQKRKDWFDEDMKKFDTQSKADEDAIFGELKKDGRFGRISIGGRSEEQKL